MNRSRLKLGFSRSIVGPTALAASVVLTACAGSVSAPIDHSITDAASASVAGLDTETLELRALLLMMSDQKFLDPVAVASAASSGPELRRQLALTLARVGDPRGGPALQSLLADDDPTVRRAAAFGLGELAERGDPAAAPALLSAIADPDPETGRLAVEGAAKANVPLSEVIQRLLEAPSGEILSRLMPSLFRFDSPAIVRWAEQGLEEQDQRPMAAYAIARNPRPEGLQLIRGLVGDPDPWIRGLAARALGRVGERRDLAALRPLLDDTSPGPVIHALRSARQLIDSGNVSAPTAWRERLSELLDDPRPDVRMVAIEVATAWLLDEALGARLERYCRDGLEREQELALTALAEAGDPRVSLVLADFIDSESPRLRSAATRAAALANLPDPVARAVIDRDAGVRVTGYEALLEMVPEPLEPVRLGLADDDFAVRSSILEWLKDQPVLPYEELAAAFERARRDRAPDARVAAVAALGKRAASASTEKGAIIELLERITREADYLSRREAAAALQAMGQEPGRLGKVASRRTIQAYRQIVARTSKAVRYAIETDLGTVTLRLDCLEAPLTCLSFQQLADQGFYDGQRLHRIVPDFVVQGGDPKGDGAGGPGYSLRDELNTLRYEAGVLGMAHAGPDTAGSQFFLTITPQPHLDGGYTIFGRVVDGFELLRKWVQGQEIRRIYRVGD